MITTGFRKGSFATVWKVEPKSDKWTKIRINISRKNKDTGDWEEEFSGFVECLGTACASKAAKLKERDRIRLGDVDVTTRYDKASNTTYTNFKMTDFEMAGEPQGQQVASSNTCEGENDPADDLPF